MNKISRRGALVIIPAAAVLANSPAFAAPVDKAWTTLVEEHASAYENFLIWIKATDTDQEPSDEDWAEWQKASDEVFDCVQRLALYPPQNAATKTAKCEFFQTKLMIEELELTPEHVRALVRSIGL